MDKKIAGPILRKERKAQGLTIEDVVEHLSFETTTLSNLERGFTNVAEEKYIEYAILLKKEEELFGIILEETQKERARKKRLEQIEYIASIVPEKAFSYLDNIHQEIISEENYLLTPVMYYLKGICHFKLTEWESAEKNLHKAIKLVEGNEDLKKSNVKSASLNHLGAINYFHQNDLVRALEYTQKGIDSFDLKGERLQQYYLLLLNKPVYLEEMNLNEKALQATKDLELAISAADLQAVLSNVKATILIQIQDL